MVSKGNYSLASRSICFNACLIPGSREGPPPARTGYTLGVYVYANQRNNRNGPFKTRCCPLRPLPN